VKDFMNDNNRSDPFVLRRYFALAVKNLRRRVVRTGLTVLGVALAVTVAVSLGGFMLGYRTAIDKSINMLGFQVMIMAKGCPYEAATMMLKGGTGLLYLPGDTYEKVRGDPDIESITPIFVGVAQKQGSNIRDDAGGTNFSIISGIEVPSYKVMKPWIAFKKGPGYDSGRWFSPDSRNEVVLGFEAAEYEQRKVGDTFYASITPAGQPSPVMHDFKVVGVLDRTGTQDDGTLDHVTQLADVAGPVITFQQDLRFGRHVLHAAVQFLAVVRDKVPGKWQDVFPSRL